MNHEQYIYRDISLATANHDEKNTLLRMARSGRYMHVDLIIAIRDDLGFGERADDGTTET